jgi:hypothetical protein
MNDIEELLLILEDKYGKVEVNACNDEDCSCAIFLYDDDCVSCKGNAMGN